MKILQTIFLSCVLFLLVVKDLEAKDGFLVHLSSKDPHPGFHGAFDCGENVFTKRCVYIC